MRNSSNFKIQYLRISLLVLVALFARTVSFSQISTDSVAISNAALDTTGTNEIVWTKPKPFAFATRLPKTLAWAAKESFSKKSLPAWGVIIGSTLILVPFDQKITNEVRQFSRYIGLDKSNKYSSLIGFNIGSTHFDAYEAPQNLNSVFYSLGEGSTSLFLSGGLSIYGIATKNNRARQTSSQIIQAQLAVAVTCQLLKRVSGRESPSSATAPGGVWRPFTNPSEYQKAVSHHDAFPSGHIATMMATVTVLSSNYPEKKWIRPVGYGLMCLTGLAMINNGVHWAGDYPLAIGIGYVSAKATVKFNKLVQKSSKKK